MIMGKISVCMATYNGEQYIQQQLTSILTQLKENDEIIISDDGSTDKTLEIIHSINDKRIKVYHHIKTKQSFILDYTTRNYEHALSLATGDIIFLADQDDVWLPGKVERMSKELEKVMLTISDCFVSDNNLNIINKSYFEMINIHLGAWKNIIRQTMLGCCMAFRRELLTKALPFPPTKVGHDLWLVIVASHYYKVSRINETLSIYRRHHSTVTSSAGDSPYSIFFKINYRFYIIRAYLKLILKL